MSGGLIVVGAVILPAVTTRELPQLEVIEGKILHIPTTRLQVSLHHLPSLGQEQEIMCHTHLKSQLTTPKILISPCIAQTPLLPIEQTRMQQEATSSCLAQAHFEIPTRTQKTAHRGPLLSNSNNSNQLPHPEIKQAHPSL